MRICSIEGCGRKHTAKSYCSMHYMRLLKYGSPDKPKGRVYTRKCYVCIVPECERSCYSRSLCISHYNKLRLRGSHEDFPKCVVSGCKKDSRKYKNYCSYHYYKLKKFGDTNYNGGNKGWRNGRWNGGTSEYKNHSLMKKNRKIKLKENGGKCEICNFRKSQVVHHKDHSKTNHSLDNLQPLCKKCHWKIHSGRKNGTSKFRGLYGNTINEIAGLIKKSTGFVYILHKTGKLGEYINIAISGGDR